MDTNDAGMQQLGKFCKLREKSQEMYTIDSYVDTSGLLASFVPAALQQAQVGEGLGPSLK